MREALRVAGYRVIHSEPHGGGRACSYFPAHSEHARAVSPWDSCDDSRLVIPK